MFTKEWFGRVFVFLILSGILSYFFTANGFVTQKPDGSYSFNGIFAIFSLVFKFIEDILKYIPFSEKDLEKKLYKIYQVIGSI